MRFSLLSVAFDGANDQSNTRSLNTLSDFIARENVSVLCIRSSVELEVISRLARRGVKYESEWGPSRQTTDGRDFRSGIVTQLPVLGSVRGCLSADHDRAECNGEPVLGARLGVSPGVIVDVITCASCGDAGTAGEQTDRMMDFIQTSRDDLSPHQAVPPPRRGRPPRAVAKKKRAEPVRLVVIACGMTPDGGSSIGRVYRERGFGLAGGSYDRSGEAVLLRPMLKPTAVDETIPELGAAGSGVFSSVFVALEL